MDIRIHTCKICHRVHHYPPVTQAGDLVCTECNQQNLFIISDMDIEHKVNEAYQIYLDGVDDLEILKIRYEFLKNLKIDNA